MDLRYWLTRPSHHALKRYRRNATRVISTPPVEGIGVGNMFSFWLWAYAGRVEGLDRWTMQTPAMEPWLQVFPKVRELVIDPQQMRLRDGRDPNWYQDFDRFPYSTLRSFVAEYLLTSPQLAATTDGDPATVTVNVRRGDYYSVPKFRGDYGFDIAAYLRVAMDGSAAQQSIERVQVVSDDIDWCRIKLGFLADYGQLGFQDPADTAVDNLAQLAAARRLVLANSSFSYWSAYLSNVRYGDNFDTVWAPTFHSRAVNYGKAFQLDPRWSIVQEIPGGWDS